MYLFVPCDKKSHGTEISFPIRSNRLSHPHPLQGRGTSFAKNDWQGPPTVDQDPTT